MYVTIYLYFQAGKDIYISGKSAAIQRKVKQHNDWCDDSYQKRTETKLKKIEGLKKKYAHLGIDFSNILVLPKTVNLNEKIAKPDTNPTKSNKSSQEKNKKKVENATDTKIKPPQILKKPKSDVGLEDLLGNTINDDSEDEDWPVKSVGSDDDDLTSDEETYGFQHDSDDAETDDDQEDVESDEDSNTDAKKSLNTVAKKPAQLSKVNRFDKLIKRKPNSGGIQKPNKKVPKKAVASNVKKTLQVAACKELKPKKILKKIKA